MFSVNPKHNGFFVKQQFVKYGLKEEEGTSSCFKQLFCGKPDPQHQLLGCLRMWETIAAEDVRTWCREGGCDCSLIHAAG